MKIYQTVLEFLEKHNLLNIEAHLLVGFSGGWDSSCLLDVLSKISAEYAFKISAAHLNHNWRGDESLNEMIRAKKFCEERKIDFFTETSGEHLPKTEEEARRQRYDFFNRIALSAKSSTVSAIITGHTFSDNAETVLYRIIKGTGLSGLKGIPEVRFQNNNISIYRPMLYIMRAETINYCKKNNISPNIDSSNFEENYLRNKIRLSLIPELENYNPNVSEALIRLSEVASDAENIVSEYMELINKDIYIKQGTLDTLKYLKLPQSVKKRVLFDLYRLNNINYSYEKITAAFNFIEESACLKSGNTFSVDKNLWIFASCSEISLINTVKTATNIQQIPINLDIDKEVFFPPLNLKLTISQRQEEKPKSFPKETEMTALVDLSRVKKPIFLRTRKPGDRIQPFGMAEKTKLKKYFINRGIPEHKRDKILLLANEEEVLWAAGVGISELLRVSDITSHIIRVDY